MPAALSVTHLDMHTAPVEPVLTVVALNHEGVVVFATADAVRLQRLRQPIHEFAICEVDFDLACLLFQTFQNLSTHNPVETIRVLRCILFWLRMTTHRYPVCLSAVYRRFNFFAPHTQFAVQLLQIPQFFRFTDELPATTSVREL